MAFDFLGSLLGKKKAPAVKKTVRRKETLDVADILSWIEKEFSGDAAKDRNRFSDVSGDILSSIEDFQKNVESMRKRTFEAGDRTYAAVNMIKDTWAKKALMGMGLYRKDYPPSKVSQQNLEFPVFRDMYHSTVKLMNELSMIPKQKLVLDRYFENESRKMGEILQNLGTLMESMRVSVNQNSILKSVSRVRKLLDEFEQAASEARSLQTRMKDAEKRMSSARDELGEARRRLSEVEKDPEWKEMETLSGEIGKLSSDKEHNEREIKETLGGMKRVFRLFSHDGDLTKPRRKLAEDLSHSPLKTFLSSDPMEIHALIDSMCSQIEKGSFSLSDKDRGKLSPLKKMNVGKWSQKMSKEHQRILAEMKNAQKIKEGIKVSLKKGEAERMMEKSRKDLSLAEKEKEDIAKRLDMARSSMAKKKKEISSYIKESLGREVEIK